VTRTNTIGYPPPPTHGLPTETGWEVVLGAFDQRVDALFDPLRGKPAADTVAAVLSNLSDYGAVWTVLAAFKARRPGPRRVRAIEALAASGFSSLIVSRIVKLLVKRQRPHESLRIGNDGPVPVRTPSSSSFPSGHTLASFSTAVVLAETNGEVAALVTLATAVAASRVHLRDHHPSDVVGGAVLGLAIGALARFAIGRSGRGG
jgi:membrane-associated phospholipid phosphatase